MLIKCPECGNQVSDKATSCPLCGCPIEATRGANSCLINSVLFDLTEVITMYNEVGGGEDGIPPVYLVNLIRNKTSLDDVASKRLARIIIESNAIPDEFVGAVKNAKIGNTPKCPTCNSINIEKISATSKAVGAVAFGLFSKTAKSQFKCKNCGYKW